LPFRRLPTHRSERPRLDPEAKEKDSRALIDVEVIGSQEWEVNAAIKAVKDMATKGYCSLLAGDNFSEGSISVHSTFLPELIGKGGSVLKTLQNHYNVKITVPQVPRDSKMECKVMVVGDKKDVKRAKECIKVLCKYHHTEITHPGMCHDEMELDQSVHGYVIGYKGSMIHHIQKNFKVAVHIPGPYSLHENVLVVGEPDDVRRAVTHISKEVEKALEPKQSAEELIAAEATAAVALDQEEEALEPWMKAYVRKGGASNMDFAI
jgi:rRNA processing protein Krr1/Pno1